jgi:hypothetical protein
MSAPIRGLMLVTALTLFAASAIHSGLLSALDPFDAAAVPEAVIGIVLTAGAVGALLWWPRAWPFALGATLFAVLGTLVGLRFTLPRGEPGDIAYHVTLLLMLMLLTVLLVRQRRRARSPGHRR